MSDRSTRMALPVEISTYHGDFLDLMELLRMSAGFDTQDGISRLLDVEIARGTQYFTAIQEGKIIGLIGLYCDPQDQMTELEPPQIIDLAVLPECRGQGTARKLVEFAVEQVRSAGFNRVWLYTDGNNAGLLNFYRKLDFKLAASIPDWFGDGTIKAIFRRDL